MELGNIISKLKKDSDSFKRSEQKYLSSYQVFIDFFNSKSTLSSEDVIIGINFSYGWMPTILHIYSPNLKKQVEILNGLKNDGVIPSNPELELLKSAFNNSIVGTSKLMHFIRPDIIPIWDSRVASYLYRNLSFGKSVNSINQFLKYLEFCQNVIKHREFKKIKQPVQAVLGDGITDLRALEQLMFHS